MRWCKKCGGLLEWGLPYTEDGYLVASLYCWFCNKRIMKKKIKKIENENEKQERNN